MYGFGAAGGGWGGALTDLVRVPYAEAMMVRLPEGVTPAMAASAGDNIADAYRTVAGALQERPGADVLVAGSGSIALFAAWWARALGAEQVVLCSPDTTLLERAAGLDVGVEQVTTWPRRFRSHAITVDATNDPAGLACVIRSTEAFGRCTSASIYFAGDITMPLFDMNMKGIRFDTGRANSAALLPEVLELIARHRLRPETVEALVTSWEEMPDALLEGAFKPIAVRGDTSGAPDY